MRGHPELLRMAELVAYEKGIEKEDIIRVLELAFQKSARQKYGIRFPVYVFLDRDTGAMTVFRSVTPAPANDEGVVEESPASFVEPYNAVKEKEALTAGLEKKILEQLPPVDMTRVNAKSVGGMIVQYLREIERERQYQEFKDRIGHLMNGIVRRVEFGHLIVEIQKTEALLRREELMQGESLQPGERLQAVVLEVRREERGSQVFLSRRHASFLMRLFEKEVPELAEGPVQIKAVARDAGSRSKVAVFSSDPGVDAIGACVGVRGTRIQAVSRELRGEKIDMVAWSDELPALVANALSSIEIEKIVVEHKEEGTARVLVIVPDAQKSLAIGRGGQNVRLASELVGVNLDILSASEEAHRRSKTMQAAVPELARVLDVDEEMAKFLFSVDLQNVRDVVAVPETFLYSLEGFTQELADELKKRAQAYVDNKEKEERDALQALTAPLTALGVLEEWIEPLNVSGVGSVEDLAGLSEEELLEALPAGALNSTEAGNLIMRARAVAWGNQ